MQSALGQWAEKEADETSEMPPMGCSIFEVSVLMRQEETGRGQML